MIRSCLQNVSNSESTVESVINADGIIHNKINDDNSQANVEFEGIELTINVIFFITSKLIFKFKYSEQFRKARKSSSDEEVFELEECLLLQDDKQTSMSQTICQETNKIEYFEYNEDNINNSTIPMDHFKNTRIQDVAYHLNRRHKRKFYECSEQPIVQNDRSSNYRSSHSSILSRPNDVDISNNQHFTHF